MNNDKVEGLVPEWAVEPVNPHETLQPVQGEPQQLQQAALQEEQESVQVQVLYDFNAESPEELTCNAGDRVIVQEEVDGWLLCNIPGTSRSGLVPASYVAGYE